jgi:N-acetylglucosamine-6-phosphate deacetylase
LPTTVTAPDEDLLTASAGVGRVHERAQPGEARVLGLHLEGPFISNRCLGAQPPFARPPDRGLFDRLRGLVPIRVLTMAPEEDDGFSFIRHATAAGTRVQIGHSDAAFEIAAAALTAGASGFTHLFNAMRPMQHRDPGTAGAALALATSAELIPDLQHVAAGTILAALRAIPGLYGITDAIEATGMPDGEYHLGRHVIHKAGPTARLADGTLAGSVLTMDQALRNLVGIGLPVEQASRRLSTLPALYLRLQDRGRLAPGAVADILVLDSDLRLLTVICRGEAIA